MKLYFRYISLLLKSQLQYRASFLIQVVTQFIQPFALTAGIFLLFDRFGSIDGWSLYEILMCYSVVGSSMAAAQCFARGVDKFPGMVQKGDFDRLLVRPRSALFQVLVSDFDIKRIGMFVQTLLVLAYAIYKAEIVWSVAKAVMLVNMLLGGTLIFSGVFLLEATAAFWTVESLEVANIFTHGMKEHASYPLNIFPKWITYFFTFIIPFGTINYLPMRFMLDRIDGIAWLYAFLPLLGGLFIIPCMFVWQIGVRRYASTGS